jgi:nitrogenase subunit NifH
MQIESYSQQKQTYLGGIIGNKNNSKMFFTENYNSFGTSPLNQSPKKNQINNLCKVTKNETCVFKIAQKTKKKFISKIGKYKKHNKKQHVYTFLNDFMVYNKINIGMLLFSI